MCSKFLPCERKFLRSPPLLGSPRKILCTSPVDTAVRCRQHKATKGARQKPIAPHRVVLATRTWTSSGRPRLCCSPLAFPLRPNSTALCWPPPRSPPIVCRLSAGRPNCKWCQHVYNKTMAHYTPPLSSSPKWSWERALGYSLAITVTPPGDTVERKSYSVRPVRFKRIENNDSGYAVGKHERKFRKRKTVTSKQIRYGKVLKNKLQDRIETSVGRCDE